MILNEDGKLGNSIWKQLPDNGVQVNGTTDKNTYILILK